MSNPTHPLMDETPLPCPFCGGPSITQVETDGAKWGAMQCSCGARGPDVRTGHGKPEEWRSAAVEEWNRRASPRRDGSEGAVLDEKALDAAWRSSEHTTELGMAKTMVPPKVVRRMITAYLTALRPAREPERCDCGHAHSAGADGEDLGCATCECAWFTPAREPEGEPVAWIVKYATGRSTLTSVNPVYAYWPDGEIESVHPLYTHPTPAREAQTGDVLLRAANLLREASTEYERVGGGATPFGTQLLEGAESLEALRYTPTPPRGDVEAAIDALKDAVIDVYDAPVNAFYNARVEARNAAEAALLALYCGPAGGVAAPSMLEGALMHCAQAAYWLDSDPHCKNTQCQGVRNRTHRAVLDAVVAGLGRQRAYGLLAHTGEVNAIIEEQEAGRARTLGIAGIVRQLLADEISERKAVELLGACGPARETEDGALLDFFEAHKTKMGPAIRAACLDEFAPTIRATIAECMAEREGDDDEDGNDGEDEFDSPSSPTPPSGASPNA